jgi:hypothetical protein
MPSVPRAMVDSSVRHAFERRGMQLDTATDLCAIIEGDRHFVVDRSASESDPLVRDCKLRPALFRAVLPAGASPLANVAW